MLRVVEIRTAEEMDRIHDAWNDLVDRSPNAGIFQTWEWLSSCRTHFGRRKPLSVICVYEGDKLVGLAPLEITTLYKSPLRRLQFIGGEVSDYLDFILDAEHEDSALQAIFSWLESSDGRWDVLDLQQIPEGSRVLHHESECRLLEQEMCPYLPLPKSWDAFLAGLGKKTRWNINYYQRRISREFDMEMSTLTQKDLDEGMDAFFRLHTKRWRQRWLPGTFYSHQMKQFHKDVARLLLDKDRLRLHAMRLNGELQAVLYCFACKDKAYYYLGGFETDLAKYSLGTVLTSYAIEDAIEHGLREFDFLRGNEPYKTRWTHQTRMNSRLIVEKGSARSALAARLCHAEHAIQTRVKDWLHGRFGTG